jgi:hypothetical protein
MAAEALAVLAKTLTEITTTLMKMAAEDQTRQRLGELIVRVADCVSAIADDIEASKHSTERCGELSAYVHHLNGIIAKQINQDTANQMTFWLRNVEAVPGVAKLDIGTRILSEVKPRWTKHRRFEQAEEVRRIAGTIRGLGNMIHV